MVNISKQDDDDFDFWIKTFEFILTSGWSFWELNIFTCNVF